MLSKLIAIGVVIVAIVNFPNLNSYQQKAVQVDLCNLPESQAVRVIGEIITLNQGRRNTDFTIQDKAGCIVSVKMRNDEVYTFLEVASTYQVTGKATQGIITNVTSLIPFNQADSSKYETIKAKDFSLDKFTEVNPNKYTIRLRNKILSVSRDQMYELLDPQIYQLTIVPNGNEYTLVSSKPLN